MIMPVHWSISVSENSFSQLCYLQSAVQAGNLCNSSSVFQFPSL